VQEHRSTSHQQTPQPLHTSHFTSTHLRLTPFRRLQSQPPDNKPNKDSINNDDTNPDGSPDTWVSIIIRPRRILATTGRLLTSTHGFDLSAVEGGVRSVGCEGPV